MIRPPKPHPQPKPKPRLSTRKKVTIALGILAGGGTVVAADRQQTEGTAKSNHGKVSGVNIFLAQYNTLSDPVSGPHANSIRQADVYIH